MRQINKPLFNSAPEGSSLHPFPDIIEFICKHVELIQVSGGDGVGEPAEWSLFGPYINFILVAVETPTDHVSGEI